METTTANEKDSCCKSNDQVTEIDVLKVIYSSLTGTSKVFAQELKEKLLTEKKLAIKDLQVVDITEYDNDDLLAETAICVFILSSYNVEGPLDWYF